MNKSWDHEVRPLPDWITRQMAQWKAARDLGHGIRTEWNQAAQTYDYADNGEIAPAVFEKQGRYFRCSVRCPERVAFVACYSYVTGRAGRTSRQERQICRKHAETFAKRYGVAMPDPVVA
jgi:hypothetical protein